MTVDIYKHGILSITDPLKNACVYVMIDKFGNGVPETFADNRAELARALGYSVPEGLAVIEKAITAAGAGVDVPDDLDIIERRVLCQIEDVYKNPYIIEAHSKETVRKAK